MSSCRLRLRHKTGNWTKFGAQRPWAKQYEYEMWEERTEKQIRRQSQRRKRTLGTMTITRVIKK